MPEASETSPDKHDLGVVFVHGIGQQRRGDPLRWFVDPLVSWLQRWLTRNEDPLGEGFPLGGPGVRVEEADLETGDDPSHAILKIRSAGQDGSSTEASWLVSEAHWADEVHAPSFVLIAGWMLLLAPYLAFELFLNIVRRQFAKARAPRDLAALTGVLWTAISVVLAPILAGLLLAVIVALLVLRAVPAFGISRFARRVGLALSASLGDSYVLTRSPTQFGVMVGTALHAMRWTALRCKRLVVVAHSQGAAIAHAALQRSAEPETPLFVSLGSGLKRLHVLTALRRRTGALITIAIPCIAAVSLLLTAGTKVLLHQAEDRGLAYGASLLTLAAIALVGISFALTIRERQRLSQESLWIRDRPGMTWMDFYASRDLVPDGPLVEAGERGAGRPTSVEVTNLASVIRDHTSYMANADQLLADLVPRLDALSERPVNLERTQADGQSGRAAAWAARARRVKARALLRTGILAGAVAWFWSGASNPPAPPNGSAPPIAADVLPPPEVLPFRGVEGDTIELALISVGAILVGFFLLFVLWGLFNSAAISRFFAGKAPRLASRAPKRPVGGAVVVEPGTSLPGGLRSWVVVALASALLGVVVSALLPGAVAELDVWNLTPLVVLALYAFFVGLRCVSDWRRERIGALLLCGSVQILAGPVSLLLLFLGGQGQLSLL